VTVRRRPRAWPGAWTAAAAAAGDGVITFSRQSPRNRS
jgi:hypothetical protein